MDEISLGRNCKPCEKPNDKIIEMIESLFNMFILASKAVKKDKGKVNNIPICKLKENNDYSLYHLIEISEGVNCFT